MPHTSLSFSKLFIKGKKSEFLPNSGHLSQDPSWWDHWIDPKQEEEEEAGYQPESHGGVQKEGTGLKQMVNLTRTGSLSQW